MLFFSTYLIFIITIFLSIYFFSFASTYYTLLAVNTPFLFQHLFLITQPFRTCDTSFVSSFPAIHICVFNNYVIFIFSLHIFPFCLSFTVFYLIWILFLVSTLLPFTLFLLSLSALCKFFINLRAFSETFYYFLLHVFDCAEHFCHHYFCFL